MEILELAKQVLIGYVWLYYVIPLVLALPIYVWVLKGVCKRDKRKGPWKF